MISFVATLRSGGDFKPWDAITLAMQVRRHLCIPHTFICMTDMPIGSEFVQEIPLAHEWPGWWSMIEMFRIEGPVVASGLDMIVLDSINRLGELAIACPKNIFYMARPQSKPYNKGERWCSGFQIWNGDWSWLYTEFDPDTHIEFFDKEQRYTAHKLHCRKIEIRAVQDYFDGYYSYRNHCRRGAPKNARVVLFHGHPRPSQCKEKWVREIYRNQWKYIHPFERIRNETKDSISASRN